MYIYTIIKNTIYMLPLTKETYIARGVRFWKLRINGHYYGLRTNPAGTIVYNNLIDTYHVVCNNNVFEASNLRAAARILSNQVLKPYFV